MNNKLERILKEAALAKLEVPGFALAHSIVSVIMTFNVQIFICFCHK